MDDRGAVLDLLRQGRWFGGLAPALQQMIVARSRVERFAPGEHLIVEGTRPPGLYAVLEGRVRVTRRLPDGRDLALHIGAEGFWVGDYGVLSGGPTVGGTVADTRVRALFLPIAEFERIVEEEPRHYRAFMDLLLARYRHVFASFAEMQGLATEERLLKWLAAIAAMWRDDRPTDAPVAIPLSQAELATMLGLSRQRLSTLLGRLRAQGRVEVGFRSVRVLD